ALVNLDGSVSGSMLKVCYVNGIVMIGSSFNGLVAFFATAGGTAMLAPKKLKDGTQVEIIAAEKIGNETWFQGQAKSAPHVKGWLRSQNVSYRIYFAFSHGLATPGATGSIPQ